MTKEFIVELAMEAIKTGLLVSAPMLGFVLTVRLLMSIFQTVISVNDLTLSYIPKILAVFVS